MSRRKRSESGKRGSIVKAVVRPRSEEGAIPKLEEPLPPVLRSMIGLLKGVDLTNYHKHLVDRYLK